MDDRNPSDCISDQTAQWRLLRMKEKKLNETEKYLLSYIEDHIEEISSLSSRELARRTYTNPTMILRFSKKMGYKNFNEFKMNILHDLKNRRQDGPKVMKDVNAFTSNNRLAVMYEDIVSKTRTAVNLQSVSAVMKQMNSAAYLDFAGTDLNESLTVYASHMFSNLGKTAVSFHDMHRILYLGLNASEDHLVFLFSKDGTNHRILQCAKELKRRHVPTVAVTSVSDSPLSKTCDYFLQTLFDKPFLEMGNMAYTISAQYILNLLYLQYFSEHYDEVIALTERYGRLLYSEK